MTDSPPDSVLYYVHDPMCSWCWGFEPVRAKLVSSLPEEIEVRRLLGGLAPDSDKPMPAETRGYLQQTWRRIEQQIPGTRFNFDFWTKCTPRRSTWPACRAIIAAREQVTEEERDTIDRRMTAAIQQAYYLQARNPSDLETLVGLSNQIGLDSTVFRNSLHSAETQAQLETEMSQARAIQATSFPSLVMTQGDSYSSIPLDYRNVETMLEAITVIA